MLLAGTVIKLPTGAPAPARASQPAPAAKVVPAAAPEPTATRVGAGRRPVRRRRHGVSPSLATRDRLAGERLQQRRWSPRRQRARRDADHAGHVGLRAEEPRGSHARSELARLDNVTAGVLYLQVAASTRPAATSRRRSPPTTRASAPLRSRGRLRRHRQQYVANVQARCAALRRLSPLQDSVRYRIILWRTYLSLRRCSVAIARASTGSGRSCSPRPRTPLQTETDRASSPSLGAHAARGSACSDHGAWTAIARRSSSPSCAQLDKTTMVVDDGLARAAPAWSSAGPPLHRPAGADHRRHRAPARELRRRRPTSSSRVFADVLGSAAGGRARRLRRRCSARSTGASPTRPERAAGERLGAASRTEDRLLLDHLLRSVCL